MTVALTSVRFVFFNSYLDIKKMHRFENDNTKTTQFMDTTTFSNRNPRPRHSFGPIYIDTDPVDREIFEGIQMAHNKLEASRNKRKALLSDIEMIADEKSRLRKHAAELEKENSLLLSHSAFRAKETARLSRDSDTYSQKDTRTHKHPCKEQVMCPENVPCPQHGHRYGSTTHKQPAASRGSPDLATNRERPSYSRIKEQVKQSISMVPSPSHDRSKPLSHQQINGWQCDTDYRVPRHRSASPDSQTKARERVGFLHSCKEELFNNTANSVNKCHSYHDNEVHRRAYAAREDNTKGVDRVGLLEIALRRNNAELEMAKMRIQTLENESLVLYCKRSRREMEEVDLGSRW